MFKVLVRYRLWIVVSSFIEDRDENSIDVDINKFLRILYFDYFFILGLVIYNWFLVYRWIYTY